jgi:thioredoxin reductase/NAD-dependent dihydropyrimidine dehydrogenase PreA subunit
VLKETREAGLSDPVSLHPVFDPSHCIGSGSCVKACPEHALGLINGKAQLINPSVCIGHGACMAACAFDAIKLVFGTEKRGVDIPYVNPNFETNVSGIFIAGELGGMGLVRKAAEQGKQAINSIKEKRTGKGELDVVIVGAGPAGLSAGLSAIENKLNYVIIDQESSLGGTIYHYPRNKIVMTSSVNLALVGTVKLGEISKESLLSFWQDIVSKTGLKVNFNERMDSIEKQGDTYVVKTPRGEYRARSVLLAIGRRGTPRKLGVPGEELPKVVYRLIDPEQYKGQKVLVVGGGDSALEAAIAISEQPDSSVILSYRGDVFGRVKVKNRQRLEEAERSGKLKVALNSNVLSIHPDSIVLETEGQEEQLPNDAVIISAGGILPTDLLKKVGIEFETKHGTT